VKIGVILPYEGGLPFADALEMTERAEALGFDSVWVPEAWGTDAVSSLGALAARTERIRLGTGIVNVFSRTPTLLGQTAATLDLISNGRFILGLGTSGHQVVTGWHGMAFDRPLQRMRETVEIVRRVLRQERLRFKGEVFTLDQGLKLLARPVRDAVPIFLATLTPGGLRLTGEVADGWIPTLFSPDHLDLFRPELEAGARAAGRSLDSLEIAPYVPVLIDDDRSAALAGWVHAPRTFTTRLFSATALRRKPATSRTSTSPARSSRRSGECRTHWSTPSRSSDRPLTSASGLRRGRRQV